MAAKRSKTAVHFFGEGGFVVRGVIDVHEAYQLALSECEEQPDGEAIGYEAYDARQDEVDDQGGWPHAPEQIAVLANEVWTRIQGAQVQRCRMVPCRPDHPDGYAWLLWKLKPDAKGQGVFTGVVFS